MSDKLREVTPVVLKLNGIAGISVKDKFGEKREEAEERQSDGQKN